MMRLSIAFERWAWSANEKAFGSGRKCGNIAAERSSERRKSRHFPKIYSRKSLIRNLIRYGSVQKDFNLLENFRGFFFR